MICEFRRELRFKKEERDGIEERRRIWYLDRG